MSITTIRRSSRAWGRRQLYSFFSSLGTLLQHRVGTLMTVLVLGIAMALPLGLYVTVKNLRALDLQQDQWGAITVFLQRGAGEDQAMSLVRLINQDLNASAQAVSPEQGMEEFREASGFGQALEMFDDNPLPWVILVMPGPAEGEELRKLVAKLDEWLQNQPEVDLVQVDFKWLQRLAGLLELGDALISVLTIVFSLAVVVVVANTIRMDVASRAEEIQVLSLVGANDSFIRQPFLYTGFWYGLLGALLALLLLSLAILYLNEPLEHLLQAYGTRFEQNGLGALQAVFVLLAGGLLGFGGAWVSVQRSLQHMKKGGSGARG